MVTFTVVDIAIEPHQRRKYELHAAGCRDLNTLDKGILFDVEDKSATLAVRLAVGFLRDQGKDATPDDFYIQSCCQPVRLRKAGRVTTQAA